MSDPHVGGDHLVQFADEAHNHAALAQRAILSLLDIAAATYGSPSLLKGTSANAMMVSIADSVTGAPTQVKNPSTLASGALGITEIVLYSVTAKTWVTKIRARNKGSVTRSVTIGYSSSSTGTVIYPWPSVPLDPNESVDFIAGEGLLGLSIGNIIVGNQDTGTDCDFIICGEALP